MSVETGGPGRSDQLPIVNQNRADLLAEKQLMSMQEELEESQKKIDRDIREMRTLRFTQHVRPSEARLAMDLLIREQLQVNQLLESCKEKRGALERRRALSLPFFKAVAVRGSRYFSVFDGQTEYRIGEMILLPEAPPASPLSSLAPPPYRSPTEETVTEGHHYEGFYVYSTVEEAVGADVPEGSLMASEKRVVLRVLTAGSFFLYGNKFAFSAMLPVAVETQTFRPKWR
uniref:Uncharacterized protein n=1 Tax=Chromera velia CCMP2878 TaxID=1169474 RepID=A0A0G4HWX9_9ALVE|eukprot:Cvel_9162.t1-p1 / transcript=Cvel_9162.t1 / gene=Cvel_9162 / organism=Chromera_velia_CCMP2878 / gene_product=hypothetical protein / transcript_product=hypothetical protein / location=Cvel_scaffold521:67380-68253(+) / protein_length=229 / sequence_SO=supercontig / SO=protein_coding / is_pseudo=false